MVRILAVIAAAVFLIGAGGYWYWTTTPQYAVEEMRAAVRTHDLDKFQKFVDLNHVSSALVDDFVAEPMQRLSDGGVAGQIIMMGVAGVLRPILVSGISHEVTNFVETGSFTGRTRNDDPDPLSKATAAQGDSESPKISQNNDAQNALAPDPGHHRRHAVTMSIEGDGIKQNMTLNYFDMKFGFRRHAFKQIQYIKVDGSAAEVGILLHNQIYDKDLVLKLGLTQKDGHWQVSRLVNFPEFVTDLARLQLKS